MFKSNIIKNRLKTRIHYAQISTLLASYIVAIAIPATF